MSTVCDSIAIVNKTKQTIFVGISGGVDSSVAAHLLKQQGYDVHGIFVKTWSPEWLPCTWVAEKRDAMRVCAALDIPFHFLDAETAYKEGVAEYMIAEYRAGRTPNPDVLCNRIIKFGVMWDYAQAHGADSVATGHYARVEEGQLKKGIDPSKDQSYFLWMLEQQELAHVIFPIGHLEKHEVRSIAEKAKLFTAVKKDSQGICFLGDVDMKEFLKHYITEVPGEVLNEAGEVIGTHDGVWFHTLGERHGFTITKKTTSDSPYYVIDKNIENNTLTVSHQVFSDKDVSKKTISLRDTNWITMPHEGNSYTAQIRYHGAFIPAQYCDEKIILEHSEPLPLGQSVVLYDDDIVVGGGVIDKVA